MPLLQALRDLGGSATPVEARKKIIENEHLSDEIVSETRGKTKVNKFENEVAFARNYLVGAGYIDKSVRGVWTLTEAGKSVELTAEMASDIFKKGVSDAKSKKTNDSDALADSDVDTVHYWIYAPGQNADKWEECYKNGYMLLGWGEIGDLGVFSSKDEMKQQMKKEYGDSSSYKNSAHATWQFVHDIKIGARRARPVQLVPMAKRRSKARTTSHLPKSTRSRRKRQRRSISPASWTRPATAATSQRRSQRRAPAPTLRRAKSSPCCSAKSRSGLQTSAVWRLSPRSQNPTSQATCRRVWARLTALCKVRRLQASTARQER